MDTIFLYNQNGDKFPTDVVRYFTLNNKKYFIFTLNEVDDSGYVQLYATRIENEYGKLVMRYISDENEWVDIKKEIESIVTNNRQGIKYFNDLDYFELDNMVVTEFRIFKLKNEVAKELSKDKNVITSTEPKSLEAASAQNNNLTIEEILKQVSDGAKNAKSESDEYLSAVKIDNSFGSDNYEEFKSNNSITVDDYKIKYEALLDTVKSLENENIKLINELVEYKAKLATIKDIIE